MPRSAVEVAAASRLHFGMFSFGHNNVRQFGGMGVMVETPGLRLRISAADTLTATGPLAERAMPLAHRAIESLPERKRGQNYFPENSSDPFLPLGRACRIEILSAPREHVGLGVGTQLALGVAAGIRRFFGVADLPPPQLAALVGRGKRSSIGTHGFFHGGWLIEAGKQTEESLSPLVKRFALPEAWRFVLIVPTKTTGLHGIDEHRAFADLPPVPPEVTDRLVQIAMLQIAPAIAETDFAALCDGLHRFNHEAGLCFAARQYGAYANEATTALIERLRSWGIAGVGQSSWGPTIFALQPNEASAAKLAAQLRAQAMLKDYDLVISPPANHGAQVSGCLGA